MYFSDVSCNPHNSLKKMQELGLNKIIPLDWSALIVLTVKKVTIDAEIHYNYVETQQIVEFLMTNNQEVLLLEDGRIYNFFRENNKFSLILIPIRRQETYKVFAVYCSKSSIYSDVHLTVAAAFCKIIYENVLLNNEIIQERNHLASVLNSTESVIISTNLNGEIVTANKAALKFFGLNGIIGKIISEVAKNRDHYNLCDIINQVAQKNKSLSFKEMVFSNRRGKIIIFNVAVSPLYNSKNEVVGVVIIATDITTKKIMERQFEQIKQFAALGEVSAGVAHDIKNPLMSIRGCSRILQRELHDQPEYMKFLEPIIEEVDRINEVVEQMVSYGNITKKNNYTLLDSSEVLEKCINVIHFHRGSKYITIQKELDNDLPLVKGNNVQLQQALINIMINAVQAIDSEGIIKIESHYLKEKKCLNIAITDNGKGIKAKELRKIFTPFYTTKQLGSGLGLSIVKRVIKEHKGSTVINSKLNKGTRVDVFLPC